LETDTKNINGLVHHRFNTIFLVITLIFLLFSGVKDALAHNPTSGLPQDDLIALGYLDVTLYGADPTGKIDSTSAIQKAIDDGYQHRLVIFFPHQPSGERGEYR
jgi:hypothetical protein